MDDIGVAILTGGNSKRMGREKEKLPFPEGNRSETFLSHLCREFSGFGYRYISENSSQNYAFPGYQTIKDRYDQIGPLGGIYSVLSRSQTDAVFFLACDMPFFTVDAAHYLLAHWDGSIACYSVVDGIRQPLAALYTKRCLPFIEMQIGSGHYKLGNLLHDVKAQAVDASVFRKCYTNINTEEEYKKIF